MMRSKEEQQKLSIDGSEYNTTCRNLVNSSNSQNTKYRSLHKVPYTEMTRNAFNLLGPSPQVPHRIKYRLAHFWNVTGHRRKWNAVTQQELHRIEKRGEKRGQI
jgi:hypothetical protein